MRRLFVLMAMLLMLAFPSFGQKTRLDALDGIRFVGYGKYTTIQAAVNDAGTTGVVVIPSEYAGADSYTNPNNIPVLDLRNNLFTMNNLAVSGTFSVPSLQIAGPEPWVDVNTPTSAGGVGCDPTGAAAANNCFANAIAKITKSGGTIYTCGTYFFDLTVSNPGIDIITQNSPAIKFVSCGAASDNYGTSPVRGGTIFESNSNVNIADPSTAPTIALNGSGSLTGTYYMKYAIVNGAGETLVSPASTSVTASSNQVKISTVPYVDGGFSFCAYWSSDGTNYYLQPNANYTSSGGTYGGQPFLVGNPAGTPSLTSFSTAGAAVGPCAGTPPATNTATHGGVIFGIGGGTTVVNSSIELDDIYFHDTGSGALAAGLVIAGCNRCRVVHPGFEGFSYNGTSMGGESAYEQGGIGIVIGNISGVSNFNSLIDGWFYNNTLSRYITGSDTYESGKNECTVMSGQVCEDYVGGNLFESGSHVDPSGSGALAAFVWRGTNMSSHVGGTFMGKVEGLANFSGPAFKLNYMHNAFIDLAYCGQNSAAAEACVTFDSNSTGNDFVLSNQGTQCAFSDGTTCGTDATSGQNQIIYSGGFLGNGLQMPTQKSTTGTRYLCIDTTGKVTSSATACSGT